jgi:hypothetical protein
MQHSLTPAVAQELNETAQNDFEEARGRLMARIILASPVGHSEEVASVVAPVIAQISESNQIRGYFEALDFWSDELSSIPGMPERVQGYEDRLDIANAKLESRFMNITSVLKMDADTTALMNDRLEKFKEASKRLGYSEVAQMYVASLNK